MITDPPTDLELPIPSVWVTENDDMATISWKDGDRLVWQIKMPVWALRELLKREGDPD